MLWQVTGQCAGAVRATWDDHEGVQGQGLLRTHVRCPVGGMSLPRPTRETSQPWACYQQRVDLPNGVWMLVEGTRRAVVPGL